MFRSPDVLDGWLRQLSARLGRRLGLQAGVTVIEMIIAVAVVGVLALIGVPWMSCTFQKSHFVQVMEDMRQARAVVEAYEAELGGWPPNLEAAFGSRPVPKSLIYCTESNDGNEGHGNEYCTFFDHGNPSGQNQHEGTPEAGYILRTYDDLARCANVRMAWLKCCGEEPRIVSWGEDPGLPGHPSDPQGNPSGP
jgi:prepilin-type N-terminal cleavage/methylation domain-containing protein